MYIIMKNDDESFEKNIGASSWRDYANNDASDALYPPDAPYAQLPPYIEQNQLFHTRGSLDFPPTTDLLSTTLVYDTPSFYVREETMEQLLQEGLKQEQERVMQAHIEEESRSRSVSPKVGRKRKSKKQINNQRGLHHTQRYKVRFEEPAIAPAPSVIEQSNDELRPTEFVNNEYQEFQTGQHPTQIREQEKESKVRFHKQFW
jgi:hypothetical protein